MYFCLFLINILIKWSRAPLGFPCKYCKSVFCSLLKPKRHRTNRTGATFTATFHLNATIWVLANGYNDNDQNGHYHYNDCNDHNNNEKDAVWNWPLGLWTSFRILISGQKCSPQSRIINKFAISEALNFRSTQCCLSATPFAASFPRFTSLLAISFYFGYKKCIFSYCGWPKCFLFRRLLSVTGSSTRSLSLIREMLVQNTSLIPISISHQ